MAASAVNEVCVVVLGDVGRSPRMQYHTASLASLPNTRVSLVGYHGERCIPEVENAPNVQQHLLRTPFTALPRSLFLLYAPFKVLHQMLQLWWVLLFVIPPPRVVLVQNPPSIPALLAVWMTCRVRGGRMVVDWHNFGYTILALSLGASHPLVTLSKWYEAWFARCADDHICVTQAMAAWLWSEWGVRARVLHDRPPPMFHRATLAQRHDLFVRLGSRLVPGAPATPGAAPDTAQLADLLSDTPFTHVDLLPARVGGTTREGEAEEAGDVITLPPDAHHPTPRRARVRVKADRPVLLVSSTSWTADEDFGVLLQALVAYDAVAVGGPAAGAGAYPHVVVVVTGKGPQREAYEAKFAALALTKVTIRTMWLSTADYPRLLGSADLGVCLHYSSSGLDLPMKVVDMFGAGLPVCAVHYPCLAELVHHDRNGMVFHDSAELAAQLGTLLRGWGMGSGTTKLAALRDGVAITFGGKQTATWQANWDGVVRDLFLPPTTSR